ncbi:MAG: phosphoribosylanthranilate isomerase [Acidobacteriota bacterium]|jgi:phosphoribosylanthranilate isomerase|nr:phosphoribosylanthranilate isomerase [Acidobacteriota bacterium]
MKVKICGITNLEDARAAFDAGADALGFNFWSQSPRFITPLEARSIVEQLPKAVMRVGVFVNEPEPDDVSRIARDVNLTAVQLHGDESPEYCRALKGLSVIKALRVDESFTPQHAQKYETDAILLDAFISGSRGGTGRIVDWERAREVAELVPRLMLAGGLSHDNVAEAIRLVMPWGVDACSRLEIAPGKKDPALMRSFVAAARLAC